jgi:glycosyltransferase involved in cell wall biosynthesis
MYELSIIIPAWNEQKTIKKTLNNYVDYFSQKFNFEILVVMDGCTDKTYEIVKNYSKKHPQIKAITYPTKLGKGGGIIEGFKKTQGEIISFTDADGSTSPEQLHKLIQYTKNADAVIGSRWLNNSEILKNESLPRRIASRSFNILIKALFNLKFKDTQCGAKAFKEYVIKNVLNDLILTNFAFDVDLLYHIKRKGYTILEVPIQWKHDNFTELRMAKVVPSMLLSIIGLRLKYTPYWEFVPKWVLKPIFNKLKTI